MAVKMESGHSRSMAQKIISIISEWLRKGVTGLDHYIDGNGTNRERGNSSCQHCDAEDTPAHLGTRMPALENNFSNFTTNSREQL